MHTQNVIICALLGLVLSGCSLNEPNPTQSTQTFEYTRITVEHPTSHPAWFVSDFADSFSAKESHTGLSYSLTSAESGDWNLQVAHGKYGAVKKKDWVKINQGVVTVNEKVRTAESAQSTAD